MRKIFHVSRYVLLALLSLFFTGVVLALSVERGTDSYDLLISLGRTLIFIVPVVAVVTLFSGLMVMRDNRQDENEMKHKIDAFGDHFEADPLRIEYILDRLPASDRYYLRKYLAHLERRTTVISNQPTSYTQPIHQPMLAKHQ